MTSSRLRPIMTSSRAAVLDQCMFGLRHPQSAEGIQKRTRVQTTPTAMWQALDQRRCNQQHSHHQIAGTCHVNGVTITLSKYAGFYPRIFARAIVKGIQSTKDPPGPHPVLHVDDDDDDEVIAPPPNKKPRVEPKEGTVESQQNQATEPERSKREISSNPHESNPAPKRAKYHDNKRIPLDGQVDDITSSWKAVFEQLQKELPKSGVQTWNQPSSTVFRMIQERMPHQKIRIIKAGKGFGC